MMFRRLKRKIVQFPMVLHQRKFLFAILTIITLWSLGLLDKVSETSFENFSWPAEPKLFKYPIVQREPQCRFTSSVGKKCLIVTKSAVSNYIMRHAIRKTWGKYRYEKETEISTIFVVGRSDSLETEFDIDEEQLTYSDILSIENLDVYRNNTYKLFASLDFIVKSSKCVPDFILLVDDDYFVHIPNLIALLKTKNSNSLNYEGFVFDTSPFRFIFHKHRISLQEYPFSRYPPYVSAGAVLLTYQTAALFHKNIPLLKLFPFDDVYTGIVAKVSNVTPIHNPNFVFWPREILRREWKTGIVASHGYTSTMILKEYYKMFR